MINKSVPAIFLATSHSFFYSNNLASFESGKFCIKTVNKKILCSMHQRYLIPSYDQLFYPVKKSHHDFKQNWRRQWYSSLYSFKYNHLQEYVILNVNSRDLLLPKLRQFFTQKRSFYLFIYLSIYLSIYLFISFFLYLFIYFGEDFPPASPQLVRYITK